MSSQIDLTSYLVNTYYGVSGSQLQAGGVDVSEIVRRFGTPLFVYSPDIFRNKLRQLREELSIFDIHYAVKANPNREVIKVFLNEKCGLDVATAGELRLGLECGCPPAKIVLAGAGKLSSDLVEAVDAGVSEIHAESLEEIRMLSEIALTRRKQVKVGLRLNPGDIMEEPKIRLPGKAAAFGLDEENLLIAAKEVIRSPNLELTGLHFYFGTQILDVDLLTLMYDHVLQAAIHLAQDIEIPLQTIDFGGGFGVPYYEGEKELPIALFGERLRGIIQNAYSSKGLESAHFVIEPGRYLLAEGGLYVTRVISRKVSRGTNFLIVDGGMHHHLAASGNLGHILKRNFPIAIGNRMNERASTNFFITGRQSTLLDTLARNVTLPDAQPGDIIILFQSGAYGLASSPFMFRCHPEPLEVFVDQGGTKCMSEF